MGKSLNLPTLALTRGGVNLGPTVLGPPFSGVSVGGTSGATRSLALPTLALAQGGTNPNPSFLSLLEIVIGGTNCPPGRRYPLYGQRGPDAWELNV
jgi:hypothetical protein